MEKGGLTAQLAAAGGADTQGLYWGDEMRLGLIGQVRRVWAPRGVKITQAVECKYQWAYLNLAVNGLEGKLRWDWTANMKAASIAPVVQGWAVQGVQVIVWDRARGHHGDAYRDVRVKLLEQPPYSPELNPAERIMEYLRDKSEGQVYGDIAAKRTAVEAELQQVAADSEKVKQLAGWDWIRESVNDLSKCNTTLH